MFGHYGEISSPANHQRPLIETLMEVIMSHYRCECIYKPLDKIHLLRYLRPVYDWKKNPSAL